MNEITVEPGPTSRNPRPPGYPGIILTAPDASPENSFALFSRRFHNVLSGRIPGPLKYGNWMRMSSTRPFISGWVGGLPTAQLWADPLTLEQHLSTFQRVRRLRRQIPLFAEKNACVPLSFTAEGCERRRRRFFLGAPPWGLAGGNPLSFTAGGGHGRRGEITYHAVK
jgi:hypothetical protein